MEDLKVAQEVAEMVKELPEAYRRDAFKLLLQKRLGVGAASVASTPRAQIPGPIQGQTFAEFYRALEPKPKNNAERIAAVAFYYQNELNEAGVTQDEIISTMQAGGLPPPKNFPRDILAATGTRSPLLMEVPKNDRPAWRLTQIGMGFIEQRLRQT